jgi:hypothetical protein
MKSGYLYIFPPLILGVGMLFYTTIRTVNKLEDVSLSVERLRNKMDSLKNMADYVDSVMAADTTFRLETE